MALPTCCCSPSWETLLAKSSPKLRARIAAVIERGDPYFLLTGSDPDATGGCCPATEVGQANRLVEAGLLARWMPPSVAHACPCTFYAFAGEIVPGEPKPSFVVQQERRAQAKRVLAATVSG